MLIRAKHLFVAARVDGSIVRWPGPFDDPRLVAERDLGTGPAFDGGLERREGQ